MDSVTLQTPFQPHVFCFGSSAPKKTPPEFALNRFGAGWLNGGLYCSLYGAGPLPCSEKAVGLPVAEFLKDEITRA